MGHCTPPAFWMPNHAGRLSSQFGMSIDTASPVSRPWAMRAFAMRFARALTSP